MCSSSSAFAELSQIMKEVLRFSYSSISTESFLNFVRLRDSLPNLPEVALRSNDNYHGFLELLSQFVEVIERRICTHEGGLCAAHRGLSNALFFAFKCTHEAGYLG
ncbi:unnamed protein product [Wuchereria bancrofti]|uniref:Uncharacterized protein n=1 Tax=Wuchereria bancrofti TaxID=6293 RepID=A0A3P7G9J0_WUCBA|nr:unnamed protein product [Wuchereria bancrofti]